MSRIAKVWWNAQKKAWCSDVGGQRKVLAHGRRSRTAAETKLRALLDQQALLREVHGAITVARLCEQFLADTEQNLERATYESYRYGCQKFVDLFGDRLAHTLEPLDIQRFALELKRKLNDTSRAIVLRSVQRCFNWGVESRVTGGNLMTRSIAKMYRATRHRQAVKPFLGRSLTKKIAITFYQACERRAITSATSSRQTVTRLLGDQFVEKPMIHSHPFRFFGGAVSTRPI